MAREAHDRPRVLIAEDSPVYRRLIQNALGDVYDLCFVNDGNAAWQVLQQSESPTLLVLDWMLPGIDGIELCNRVRTQFSDRYSYILLLTARDSEEDLLTGMAAGADDFVRKPFSAAELRARLNVGNRIIRLNEQLVAAATYDWLTKVRNRAAIFSLVQAEMSRCRRENRPLGLILVDLDKFKQINDTNGHLAGDAVLREVATRITRCIRTYDAVGRYGGEEFLIVMPGAAAEALQARAEEIREHIAHAPVVADDLAITVTASLGSTVALPTSRCPLEELLFAADSALYRAKAAGRNRVEFEASSSK